MRYSQGCAAALLPVAVLAYNPFKASITPHLDAFVQGAHTDDILYFKPREVLTSRPYMPEIYDKALRELQSLEQKPLCHQLAAQLSMGSCRKLEENDKAVDTKDKAHVHGHSIESFTIALAMCDLELGEFIIPEACNPFTSSALLRIFKEGGDDLQVSSGQKDACLKALSQDHSHWYTLLSNRGTALLFCQAARIDIEKDEYILLHKRLAHILAQFGQTAEEQLRNSKEKMEEHTRSADSYYSEIISQAHQLKYSIKSTIATFSDDITGATLSLKTLFASIKDLSRLHRTLLATFLQSNSDVAAGHEQALADTANVARSSLESIHDQAGMTENTLNRLNEAINLLIPSVISLGQRQVALEERTQSILSNFTSMTELLQHHTESLARANDTAAAIHHNLEKAAAATQLWHNKIGPPSILSDYGLRIGVPMAALSVGNYGMASSLTRNIGLFLGGLGAGEVLVQLRHYELDLTWVLSTRSFAPSSTTQPARWKDQLVTTKISPNSTFAETPTEF